MSPRLTLPWIQDHHHHRQQQHHHVNYSDPARPTGGRCPSRNVRPFFIQFIYLSLSCVFFFFGFGWHHCPTSLFVAIHFCFFPSRSPACLWSLCSSSLSLYRLPCPSFAYFHHLVSCGPDAHLHTTIFTSLTLKTLIIIINHLSTTSRPLMTSAS